MTPLQSLSELFRSFLSLFALIFCIVGFFSIILSVIRKRFRFAVLSLIPLFANYFMWQVLFDIHLSKEGVGAAQISLTLSKLPALVWIAALILSAFSGAMILVSVIRYGKRSITPAAVKLCLDGMPCGVCCWSQGGRVLFSNVCMNRLCLELTGGPLLNGNSFFEAVSAHFFRYPTDLPPLSEAAFRALLMISAPGTVGNTRTSSKQSLSLQESSTR